MTHVPISLAGLSPEALAALRDVAENGARVILDVPGIGSIAAVPVSEAERADADDDADLESYREAMTEPGESVPWEKVKQDLGL